MSHAAWSTIKASCAFVSVAADGPERAINAESPDNSGTGLSSQYMQQQQQSMLCACLRSSFALSQWDQRLRKR